MSEQTRSALRAASKCIQTDRAAMYACHFDYALRRVDDTGQMALAEYDAVLAQIDAALAAPAKLTDEPALPEPDAVRCEWNDGWYQWHCDRDPMPASDEWNEPPQRMLTAYFADQLRTYAAEYSAPLRAEIERLTAELEPCGKYLKEGETPAERIKREIDDNVVALKLLEREKREVERLTAAVENCRLCAARHRHEPWAKDILRLLADHGIKGSPFRDAAKEKP